MFLGAIDDRGGGSIKTDAPLYVERSSSLGGDGCGIYLCFSAG